MNTSAPHQADGNGGRRPAASQTRLLPSPLSYRRVPVRELRALPIRHNPRLQVLDYSLTAAPGMVGKPRTHGHGAARLSGYVVRLCLIRDGGDWFLETEIRCYDERAARREGVTWSDRLLADLYRAVECRHLAAEGRAYLDTAGRGAGRN